MLLPQTQLVFPIHAVLPPGPLPRGAERVELATGGDQLHGVHIRPSGRPAGPVTLLLGFAGNAWNSDDAATLLHRIFPDVHVVVFHYRGYPPSTGVPSATALLDDAALVHDWAVARVRPERTVAAGFSIGSGVAAELARRRQLDGLILVTPFDSLREVFRDMLPWLPLNRLFEHEIDAAEALAGADVPVAILAAERDELVLPGRTRALRRRLTRLAYDRDFAGAGHNDLYWRPEFPAAMREALAALARPVAA